MPAFGLNVRAAFVVIAASTAILWTLLVLGIRILLRLKINGPFGRDDYACITGTAFAIIYSIISLLEIRYGLGRRSSELYAGQIETEELLSWLNNILYVLTLAGSILSVCFLITRIVSVQRKV